MTELVVCLACRRHVAVRETACPFCAAAITTRPQRATVTRIARAAIFSAALGACSDKAAPPPSPAPAPVAPGSGSDDLEKLLDPTERVDDHVGPIAAPAVAIDAAVAAESPDASVPVDAGVDPAVEAAKRRREKLRLERKRQQELDAQHVRERIREMAKPYGAPPARRRVV